jgi:hypothetical protein
MKVLDTSVAIDHLRAVPPAVALLYGLLADDVVVVASEVVRFELLTGARDSELPALEQFFSALSWVPVDEHVTRTAGSLARSYRHSHSGIDTADYLIAATALLLEADLLTMNTRHFPMFEDLRPPY